MRRNVYSSALITGVDLFALRFHLDRVIPHSWYQRTRDTGLPDGENCILLRSLVLTKYRSVTDRQTDLDGRTDGFAVAYTALRK